MEAVWVTRGVPALRRMYQARLNYDLDVALSRQSPLKTVRALLEAGADPRAIHVFNHCYHSHQPRTRWEWIVAHLGQRVGHCDIHCDSSPPLNIAAEGDDAQTVELLLAFGASVNDEGQGGETALGAAVRADRVENMKVLVARGANVNVKMGVGYTLLMNAVTANHPACVEYLLAHGADYRASVNRGQTALTLAKQGNNLRMIHMLEQAQASK